MCMSFCHIHSHSLSLSYLFAHVLAGLSWAHAGKICECCPVVILLLTCDSQDNMASKHIRHMKDGELWLQIYHYICYEYINSIVIVV